LFFLLSCQTETRKSNEETLAANIETVSTVPKVTQIDAQGLKNLLKSNGKPLLINFWATWCAPCREEFPELVKIGTDYKGKVDLITVSLDELSEINGGVPKFLAQMKSESPAYLLKTPDDEVAIELVSKNWQGALPFTILFNVQGETIYSVQGKFKTDVLAAEIEKILTVQSH
jgi:thiol-disulfide isomerase/thioredoxin